MRAIVIREFGPPEVLVPTEPEPQLGPGQVLVEVAFANVTFVETQLRAGTAPFGRPELPLVPGNGVGGVVARVGDDLDSGWVGRRVVCSTGGSGGYAQLVAVDATELIEVPHGLGMADAVALLADGRTAMALVEKAEITAGEWVLVEAAAGGVGTLVTQLCVQAGARVLAAAGGTAKLQVAADLGAEAAVDYADPGWPTHVRARTSGVDVVFDGVGGPIATAAFELLRPGGRMLSYGMASGSFAAIGDDTAHERQVRLLRGVPVTLHRAIALSTAALAAAAQGRLTAVIGQRFPLDRAADAHAAIESRATIGKTLLEVPPAQTSPSTDPGSGE